MKTGYIFFAGLLSFLWIQGYSQTQNTLDFDGVDDYVNVADHSSLDGFTAFTIEVWIKLTTMDASKGIISKRQSNTQNSYVLMIRNTTSRRVYFRVNSEANTFYAPFSLSLGKWHHIAVVFNGNNPSSDKKKIYIDGILRASGTSTETSVVNSTAPFRMGWLRGTANSFINGSMDEVRLWNVERTETQIRNNMYKQLDNPTTISNLVAYYNFDQTSGTALPDESVNTNDGTLTSMDPATDWVSSTAPIPYFTFQNGNWNDNNTWAAGQYSPVNAWMRGMIDHEVVVTNSAVSKDLTINNTKKLTINPVASLTVTGLLTNNAGTGGLIIKAGTGGTGSLIHNTPNINGTVEQYLTADTWHYISSPVASAVSMVYYNIYLMKWTEPTNAWAFISGTNVPLNVTQGFAAWASGSLTGSTTVSFTGVLNTGDKTASLTYTTGQGNGWNFIGNPYPSSVEWNTNWTTTNVDPTVYVWSGSQYLTWNRSTQIGTKTDGTIPVTQGFYVKANAASPSLTIPQSERIHGVQAFYKSDDALSYFRLKTIGNGYEDIAVISFDKFATADFDNEFDAFKLWGISDAPQLYSIIEGDELAVNTIPYKTDMVNIGYKVGVAGTYTLILDEMAGEFHNISIYLEDKKENNMINLATTPKYIFTADPSDNPERFILHFGQLFDYDLPKESNEPIANIYSFGNRVYIQTPDSGEFTAKVYTLTGQEIQSVMLDKNCLNSFSVMQKSGTYLVRIFGDSTVESKKLYIQND